MLFVLKLNSILLIYKSAPDMVQISAKEQQEIVGQVTWRVY
jgi:hypothetical protein